MAEDEGAAPSHAAQDSAADRLALGAASHDKADAYLDKQGRFIDLQSANLIEQNAFELSHLRWRRFNDSMYGFLQMMLLTVGAVIVVAIAAAIVGASQADGLVIEAFSVPPALAQKGLTGPVVAAKLLDRLTAMQDATDSARAPSSFKNNWTGDIKVEIPDTGISLGEALRYLHDWLGHEQHLTGEVIETPGGIALTTRLDGEPGDTAAGPIAHLDKIVEAAAEAVFHRAQPYRYSRYLGQSLQRRPESIVILRELIKSGSLIDKIWAWDGMALTLSNYGNYPLALDATRRARSLDPTTSLADGTFALIYDNMGRTEQELAAQRAWADHTRDVGSSLMVPRDLLVMHAEAEASIAEFLGDYQTAVARNTAVAQMPDYQGSAGAAAYAAINDLARNHDRGEAWSALAAADPDGPTNASYREFALGLLCRHAGDWRGVVAHMTESERIFHIWGQAVDPAFDDRYYHRVFTGPEIAVALAMLGEKAKAAAVLATLPFDCYACTRARGEVAAAQRDWRGAQTWFAVALKQGPSLPFAETDWGEMLLQSGDLDAAMARLAAAHGKGPHFADALELWGEALVASSRSDLALAKFAEAARYAPNWGRLHLKWGEALWWSGDKDGARKQFALAAGLDLSEDDRGENARMIAAHG